MTTDSGDGEAREAPGAREARTGRFTKGKTGNPKGRPRRSATVGSAILEAMNEKVPIKANGRSRKVTKLQATAMQMANKGAAGDARVGKLAMELAQKAEDKVAASPPAPETLSQSDLAVVQRLKARIRKIVLSEEGYDVADPG